MQPVPRLVADKLLSLPSHGHASIITDPKQLVRIHCHAYYEIFLVAQGKCTHKVNLREIPLQQGDLYFMRPDDVHCYINMSPDFKLINILLLESDFDNLTNYLGDSFRGRLLSPSLPPHVNVTPQKLKAIINQLEQLVLTKKIHHQQSEPLFRVTVFDLLTQHFLSLPQTGNIHTPEWLNWLSLEMLKKENFTEGLPAMYRLSGKSIEHLSRACKKYLQKSPTALVNAIRLEYASDQIQHSDASILEICDDAGFNNLSHFYHLFKKRFGVSPNQLRKICKEGNSQLEFTPSVPYTSAIPDAVPFDFVLADKNIFPASAK